MSQLVNTKQTALSEQAFWAAIFPAAAGSAKMGLFKNDIIPNETTVLGDLTEADFTGYGQVTLLASDSTHVDPVTGVPVITINTPQIFSQSGTGTINTVYGMFILDGSGGLIMASRFDAPVQMDATGKQITLLTKIYFLGITGPDPFED